MNLALLAIAVLYVRARGRPLASMLLGTVGVVILYLRGYLVPYTPEFAPQLVAASPLPDDLFHEQPESGERGSLAATAELDGEAIFERLLDAGVIEADEEMIRLTEAVEASWHDEMASLAPLPLDELEREIRRSIPTVEQTSTVSEGSEWIVLEGATEQLVAKPVAVAELAAYRTLEEYVTDEQLRLAAAETFRMFLETCPVCSTELRDSTEVSCCGGHTTPRDNPRETLVCPTCEQRVYTFPAE